MGGAGEGIGYNLGTNGNIMQKVLNIELKGNSQQEDQEWKSILGNVLHRMKAGHCRKMRSLDKTEAKGKVMLLGNPHTVEAPKQG
jgi:hypothetical protein